MDREVGAILCSDRDDGSVPASATETDCIETGTSQAQQMLLTTASLPSSLDRHYHAELFLFKRLVKSTNLRPSC